MSNKNVCMTTEHNDFLTVTSKEVALLYQTAENLLQDAISDSVRRVKTAPCAIRQLNFNAKYGHYKMVQKL